MLRGGETISLRKLPRRRKAAGAPKKSAAKPPDAELLDDNDAVLFEALRKLRLTLAKEQNVPSYVIFHNAALIDMAKKKPVDAEAMAMISGVGQVKLDRYGDAFLEVIKDFQGSVEVH